MDAVNKQGYRITERHTLTSPQVEHHNAPPTKARTAPDKSRVRNLSGHPPRRRQTGPDTKQRANNDGNGVFPPSPCYAIATISKARHGWNTNAVGAYRRDGFLASYEQDKISDNPVAPTTESPPVISDTYDNRGYRA